MGGIGQAREHHYVSCTDCPCCHVTLDGYSENCDKQLLLTRYGAVETLNRQQFDIRLANMREIVHLQIGQCGNQVGGKVSELWFHDYYGFLFFLIWALEMCCRVLFGQQSMAIVHVLTNHRCRNTYIHLLVWWSLLWSQSRDLNA